MAVDSIIARPTNKVRVMVAEASGCCASEVSAVATARPSPSAGHMQPMPVVSPAVAIEATATRVILSMVYPLLWVSLSCGRWCRLGLLCPRRRRDINRSQNAKDIGLHHAGEQTEQGHHERENVRRDREQDRDDHRPTHHIAKQTNSQGQRARQ